MLDPEVLVLFSRDNLLRDVLVMEAFGLEKW
jgi:hypothetical protein